MQSFPALRALACSALLLAATAPAAAAEESADFDPWTDSARYEFRYRVELDQIQAEPGDRVRLWVPAPAETPDQRVLERRIAAPLEVLEDSDARGNRIVHLRWDGPVPAGTALELVFVVERRPSRGTPAAAVVPGSPDDPKRHLTAARRVPLDGIIARLGEQESRGLETDGQKIRAFYDYVVKTMRYSKHGEGWGHGDAIWACTEKYGNCTDFHSLFLGMARSQGIAARFHIGFPIPPDETASEIPGYHCWAEAWDSARGWVPFDASEAWKAGRFDDYFGALPSDRIVFTTGRDLDLVPPQAGDPLNYFIYPYAERNGRTVEGVKGRYSFQRIASETARR